MDDIKMFTKKKEEFQTLIQVVRIYSQDTGVGFDIKRCAMLNTKRGKQHMKERMKQQNQEKSTNKYLGNAQILGNNGS